MKEYYKDIIQLFYLIASEGHIHPMAVQPVVSPWAPLAFIIIRFHDVRKPQQYWRVNGMFLCMASPHQPALQVRPYQ